MSDMDKNFALYGYIFIAITVICLIVDIPVILTILLNKHLRNKAANLFILSLTTSGLLFSCLIIPAFSYTMITGNAMPDSVCKVVAFGSWFLSGTSVYNLLVMALNRYFVIVWTGKSWLVSKQSIFIMIACCYITPGIVVATGVSGAVAEAGFDQSVSRCVIIESKSKQFVLFMIMFFAAAPVLLIVYCYIHIYWEVRKSRKRLIEFNQAQKNEANRLKKEIKLTITIGSIFVGYLITYMPSMVANNLDIEPWHPGRQVTLLMVFSFGWINPLIYALQNKQFRDAFVSFFKRNKQVHPVSDITTGNKPQTTETVT